MKWNEVVTTTQTKNLTFLLVTRIRELQVIAEKCGLLVKLKLSPDRIYSAGDIGDREEWELFLCPGGQIEFEHCKTWRAHDEWESRTETGAITDDTDVELGRFVQLCHVEISRVEEISKSLLRRVSE